MLSLILLISDTFGIININKLYADCKLGMYAKANKLNVVAIINHIQEDIQNNFSKQF